VDCLYVPVLLVAVWISHCYFRI